MKKPRKRKGSKGPYDIRDTTFRHAPKNPALANDPVEIAWSLLSRNSKFSEDFQLTREWWGKHRKSLEELHPWHYEFFRELDRTFKLSSIAELASDIPYTKLPAACRNILARGIQERPRARMFEIPAAVRDAWIALNECEPEAESWKKYSKAPAVLALEMATLEHYHHMQFFAFPVPRDRKEHKAIVDEFKRCSLPESLKGTPKLPLNPQYFGTKKQWRDYLNFHWAKSEFNFPAGLACAFAMKAASNDDGELLAKVSVGRKNLESYLLDDKEDQLLRHGGDFLGRVECLQAVIDKSYAFFIPEESHSLTRADLEARDPAPNRSVKTVR